jgi:hypothetical protein
VIRLGFWRRPAGLQQRDLLRRDRLQRTEGGSLDRRLRVLLHFEAVEKDFRNGFARDDIAVAAQEAASAFAQSARCFGALVQRPDMRGIWMNRTVDKSKAAVAHRDHRPLDRPSPEDRDLTIRLQADPLRGS